MRGIVCNWVADGPSESSEPSESALPVATPAPSILEPQPSPISTITSVGNRRVHPLPESTACRRCFKEFFDRHFAPDFMSFLYRPDFEQNYREQPFLTLCIIALSLRYLDDADASELFGNNLSPSEIRRAVNRAAGEMARDASDNPTVQNIQGNLVLALSEYLSGSGSRHWMHAGIAIRMAQVMRLNKDYHQRHSEREREIRRRTFWACFAIDRMLAISMAKPHTVAIRNIGIALPGTDLALSYQEPTKGLTLQSLQDFSGPPSEVGITPYLITTMTLWGEIADIHVCQDRFLEKLEPTNPESRFYKRHAAMRSWTDSLPAWLQWNSANYTMHQELKAGKEYVILQLLIRSAMCVAHQGYLPHNDGSSILIDTIDAAGLSLLHRDPDLIAVCVSNALEVGAIIDWIQDVDPDSQDVLCSPWVAMCLLAVSSPLLWLQYNDENGSPGSSALARKYFASFRRLFKSFMCTWKIAKEWVRIINGMESFFRAAYLKHAPGDRSETEDDGNIDSGESDSAALDDQPQYRPSPGDGFPEIDATAPLYTFLRLQSTSPWDAAACQLRWSWVQLICSWPHNLLEDPGPSFP